MFTGIIFIVLATGGIIATILAIKKYNLEGFKKNIIKFTIIPFFSFCFLVGLMFIFMPQGSKDASTPVASSKSVSIEDRQRAFRVWLKPVNETSIKMAGLVPFFNKITVGFQNKQLSRAETQVSLDQLSGYLDDVNDEFRHLKLPDKTLFTKEQNESFEFIKSNLQDASKNYSEAADQLAQFIETADNNRITDTRNYMKNANEHTNLAAEKIRSLTKELNITLDKVNDSDSIAVDLK